MIAEYDLLQAIEECKSEPITSAKISKLADFYVVYDHLFGISEPPAKEIQKETKFEKVIYTNSDSDFLYSANGKDSEKVMMILDELMEAIRTLYPRMYDSVLRKLSEI